MLNYKEQYDAFNEEHQTIQSQLSTQEVLSNPKKLKTLSQKELELRITVELFRKYLQHEQEEQEAMELLAAEDDEEMKEMATLEAKEHKAEKEKVQQQIKIALLPKDDNDNKDVIVEIRAGAGGDEASLFAANLYRMYARHAELEKWKLDIVSKNENAIGGFKEIVFEIAGTNVYSALKYESGVHRIQRIPETEKNGRIHTSTATVAILPQIEEADFEIRMHELEIDTYRASGAGGQHVNTTDSAIRITHKPTGVVVTCQDGRSQIKNKEKALTVLRSRLKEDADSKKAKEEKEERKSQIGTGDRSEKIRTYNIPQDRITDHRIKETWHGVEQYFQGNIKDMLEILKKRDQEKLMDYASNKKATN